MAISKNDNDERKCEYCGYDEANIDGSHEEYAMNGWDTGGNIRRCRYLDSVYNITFNDNSELMKYEKNIYGECSDCGWKCEYPQSHIEYSRTNECEYISAKYEITHDDDGELVSIKRATL